MTKIQIEGLVFDFDGVLLRKSERVNIAAATKTFADLGFPLTEAEKAFVPGRSTKVYVPHFLQSREPLSERAHEIIKMGRANYDAIWPADAEVDPMLLETLSYLTGKGIALAIATTNRRTVVDRFIALMLSGSDPFHVIITGEKATKHKPDPELYQLATAALGISPNKLLAVEDTTIGIEAAKCAGLHCAAFPDEFSNCQNFSNADYHISSLTELKNIV
jgi:HAD superfamily hydrolase (TIGR01509 family)